MEIYVDGKRVESLPRLTLKGMFSMVCIKLQRFRNTPLRNFWTNAYIHYRDELYRKEKAGMLTAISIPASDNHDGNPAA